MRPVRTAVLTLLALSVAGSLAAQKFPDHPRLQAGFLAWDRGDYPDAMRDYRAVLTGPGGGAYLEEIALLTGELFEVEEVTPAGRSTLRVDATGRFASFVFEEEGRSLTRVVDLSQGGRSLVTLDAATTALMAGAVAYVPTGTGEVRIRPLPDGPERTLDLQGWTAGSTANSAAGALVASPEGDVLFVLAGRDAQTAASDVLRYAAGTLSVLPTGVGRKSGLLPASGGRHVVFNVAPMTAGGGGGRGGGAGGGGGGTEVGVLDIGSGQVARFTGRTAPALSRDGSTLAFVARDGASYLIEALRLAALGAAPVVVTRSTMELASPALSPSGRTVAYQGRPVHDWEIYAAPVAEAGQVVQLSREIQNDLAPAFVDENTILTQKGEGRHRRSYLYDVVTREQTKLFHNNTVRTVAPEYEWQITMDGRKILIIADRDGDTISRERGVYVVHLDRKVSLDAVRRRLETNLAAELDLRARGERSFGSIRTRVAGVTEQIDPSRMFQYAKVLYEMDSKHISQPGNQLAIAYLEVTLRSWGYEPELQWFETAVGGGTVRTANVIARLIGTTNPELVYVLSSHFDSVEQGPGADDNSSGSTALLEVARVLKDHPQGATLEFAWFTGEEAGLRGSREFVRQAVADGKRIVGALNNDMIGWTRNHRLDNTIRYSNGGIRDIQHAAAIQFSDLITYDALYYQSTDAAAYYEAYGDIVGGIGSYPILESPHYHQRTDRLENINMRLVAEVARTTAATLMLLASSPSRLTGVEVRAAGGGAFDVSWNAAVERGVTSYRVRYVTTGGQETERVVNAGGQGRPSLRLENAAPASTVSIKAVNAQGLEGWDWARLPLTR